ncbi:MULTISPECIES: MerR family transcriptional regulator [Sphingomonadaceae]|jgi:MerR family mercuric resistance operon transcriptional regulator|uniref:Mercuric resistance operon regulatory protein n=1 Tax=Sphingobium yanoikuyae TaxID=13690 RepID=A0A0J9CTN8_SPHYA|nr:MULTISPECIES: MerR family transcriptional regulator [Sphingomonadaceae]ATP21798.1 MerR family transcriptional regulator [Sphingobium yanoikuyae]KMW28498.1 MerR family transcriptional regulator [Sphingobium yanoikuyae]KZC78030.1 MerR family transcriptional regulator [Sphingobium yanoikuyae]TKV42835.1 MerR family transcriptional regulator [Sphingobium sp. MP9-4]GFE77582.1 MerR family transcriptional regulator [Novosphingobium sp. TCA1]
METLTIGKLAAKGGVGVETVRYYQRRGLLTEPSRDEGIRRYGDEDVRRLRFIRSAQTAGFTLEEIGELLGLDAVDDRTRARHLAEARIAAIDAKIAEMQSARAALAKLASECANSAASACPIIAAFEQRA